MQLLGLWGPWLQQMCRDMDCLCPRSYGPIRVFLWASWSWWSECLFNQSFSIALPIQTLRGLPCLGSFSVVWHIRHIEGPPWLESYSTDQRVRHLMGQPLYCSAADAGMWGEGGCGDGSTLHVTQQYRFASMAAWLSSTGISHQDLLPHIPSIHLSVINSSPHPGIAPQSLNSSSQPLCLPRDQSSCLRCVWLRQGLSDSHSI